MSVFLSLVQNDWVFTLSPAVQSKIDSLHQINTVRKSAGQKKNAFTVTADVAYSAIWIDEEKICIWQDAIGFFFHAYPSIVNMPMLAPILKQYGIHQAGGDQIVIKIIFLKIVTLSVRPGQSEKQAIFSIKILIW